MMKHSFTTLRLCLASGVVAVAGLFPSVSYAVPAYPGLITVEQPDGSTIQVRATGDERGHSMFTEDGYRLMRDGQGFLTYAIIDAAGRPTASAMRASDLNLRSAAELRFIDQIRNFVTPEARMAVTREGGESTRYLCSGAAFPAKDSPRALVVLVEYQNVKFSMDDPLDFYNRMLNEVGFKDYNATGSAYDFFVENSHGLFTPQFDVYGPILLDHPVKYYGANDFMNLDVHPEEMVIEACKQLDDQGIDFSVYDTNNDGQIDNVFLFYAGYGEADSMKSETVWPHSADIVDFNLGVDYTFDGKLLNRYGCTNEIDYKYRRPDGIGTFVHEFSHVMGLPDLYATSYTSSFTPGSYSTLDMGPYNNNGRTPPHYSSFERYCLDWLSPEVLEYTGEYEIEQLHLSNKAYLIPTEKDDEFYLLENRQQECCDAYIPGHGMLVWHVDYFKPIWDRNVVNNTPSHQYVDLLEANNKRTDKDRAGTPFPGTGNVRELTDMTTPELLSWSGEKVGVGLHDIREEDGKIYFRVDGKEPFNKVENIATSAGLLSVKGQMVINRTSASASVFTAAGVKVADVAPGEEIRIAPGLYIVSNGVDMTKVKVF